jgi:TerC family integral membrane protein
MVELFPFSEYWWFYLTFIGLVVLLLGVDLGIFHRKAHAVRFREAATSTIVWIGLALLFNLLLYQYALWKFPRDARLMAIPGFDPGGMAWRVSLEFLTGYVIEKSLSVDNIFVFVMVFSYFAIPAKYQHRILFYGILGAIVFRGIFVAMGAALMQYHWVIVFFGIFLIFTGIKIVIVKEKAPDPGRNLLVRLVRRAFPVTNELHGPKFFAWENGQYHITPLLVALVFLEATDIVFAVDSVPAIFAFTTEPLIVFTSNIFAILGLRALYFMLAGAVEKFHLLRYGLGTVLAFVGLKMVWLNDWYDGKFPIALSLTIIGVIIGASVVLSLLFPRKHAEVSDAGPVAEIPRPRKSLTQIARRSEENETGLPKAPRRLSSSTVRLLRKVIAPYLLLLGLGLILRAAFEHGF